jgi:anoctamin-10
LAFPAVVGFLFWYYEQEYSSLYSVFIVLWSLGFVEWWRTRERILSVQWGSHGSSRVGKCRTQFRPERLEQDPVTGEEARVFPWWKREIRIATSLPALVGFSAGLSLLISAIYFAEVLINEVYDGPGKQYLVRMPGLPSPGGVH